VEPLGINWPLLIAQLVNIGLIFAWVALAVAALVSLRRRVLPPTAAAIWAVLILLVPVLGALAFFVVRPARG
jgi:hypothetical protein